MNGDTQEEHEKGANEAGNVQLRSIVKRYSIVLLIILGVFVLYLSKPLLTAIYYKQDVACITLLRSEDGKKILVFVLIDSFTMLDGKKRAVVRAVTLYHLVWQQEELFFIDYDRTQISVTATDRKSLVFTEFQDGKQLYQFETRFSYWGWH